METVEQLEVLVSRSDGVAPKDFDAAVRLGLGEAAHRQGVDWLVAYLVDQDVPAGELARLASFDALISVGGEAHAAHEAVLDALSDLGDCHVYRVEARAVREHPRDWPDGERTPGTVMVSAVHRRVALDARTFEEHWRDRHAPLALKHHIGMWDYRQLSVREVVSPGSHAWDGFALMGFPTQEAFETGLFDSPEGTQIILEDTERFLSLDRSETVMMSEYWLRAPR